MRILVVEDEIKIAQFIKRGLREEGYAADIAPDGEQGDFFLSSNDYDLIILDLMLPKFNGEEILKFIRANPKLAKIPVIVLSTHSIIGAKSEPILEMAHRRLIKDTCTPAIMLEAVHSALKSTN